MPGKPEFFPINSPRVNITSTRIDDNIKQRLRNHANRDTDENRKTNLKNETNLETERNKEQNVYDNRINKKIKKPKDNTSDNDKNYTLYISLCILVVGIVSILVIGKHTILSKGRKNKSFKINFNNLQNKFLGQSNRTWKILKSSTHHVITSENPDRPAVIFMVLPNKNSHPMALCLAQHFSQDIDKVLTCQTTQTAAAAAATYPFVDGDKFISYNTEDQKLKLDQSIETIVSDYNSVIISHLEKFHSKSVMLFHGLCDTTEAKYKRIAIIFLLETSNQIKDEAQLALYLENLWSDIDPVRIKPLLARLANNVIFLNPDESFEQC
ncbi:uncharacterized protein LOC115223020 [Argonauta hians]